MNHALHLEMVFAEQDLVANFSRNSSTGDRQGEIKILRTLFIRACLDKLSQNVRFKN